MLNFHFPRSACLLLAIFSISSCKTMRTYGNMQAEIEYVGQGRISILVVDLRRDVVSGERDPSNIGQRIAREGVADPRFTYSGLPLAEEMGKSLKLSLEGAKFYVESSIFSIGGRDSPETEEIHSNSKKEIRMLMLRVNDWNMDSFGKGRKKLSFDLNVAVMAQNDELLAEARVSGSETIQMCARVFFKRKLSELLNSSQIAAVLQRKEKSIAE